MKKILLTIFILTLIPAVLATVFLEDTKTIISQELYLGYEPSGIAYHPQLNKLFLVGDDGDLTRMNLDGTNSQTWRIGGDLEGATIIPNDQNHVYVAVERPFKILKINTQSGEVINSLSLVGVIPAVARANLGIEGLAYVQNGYHPYDDSNNGGLFYFGIQEGGLVHVVDVNFQDSSARLIDTFKPVNRRGDISGLHFSHELETLFVLYDGANKITEMTTSKERIREYFVPLRAQEGITLIESCPQNQAQIFIADDGGPVASYQEFGITCPNRNLDSDNDGVLDQDDICPGFDDNIDSDQDTIPDGCDDTPLPPQPNEPTTNINQSLYNGYEPSGMVYHPLLDKIFLVGDDGDLTRMDTDGNNAVNFKINGDLEGVTVKPNEEEYVYIAQERRLNILKVHTQNGNVISTLSLANVIPRPTNSNKGIEALTFVPQGHHSYEQFENKGLFYIGIEETGMIHVLDLDFQNQRATLVDSFTPVEARNDISGLHYSSDLQTLFILYDSANKIREITTAKELIKETDVLGTFQDGITLISSCPDTQGSLFIAQDYGQVIRYNEFEVTCQREVQVVEPQPEPQEPTRISSIKSFDDGSVLIKFSNGQEQRVTLETIGNLLTRANEQTNHMTFSNNQICVSLQ
jgi:uncharacterized protein YjiK